MEAGRRRGWRAGRAPASSTSRNRTIPAELPCVSIHHWGYSRITHPLQHTTTWTDSVISLYHRSSTHQKSRNQNPIHYRWWSGRWSGSRGWWSWRKPARPPSRPSRKTPSWRLHKSPTAQRWWTSRGTPLTRPRARRSPLSARAPGPRRAPSASLGSTWSPRRLCLSTRWTPPPRPKRACHRRRRALCPMEGAALAFQAPATSGELWGRKISSSRQWIPPGFVGSCMMKNKCWVCICLYTRFGCLTCTVWLVNSLSPKCPFWTSEAARTTKMPLEA